jgi:hypothetical protein
VLPSSMELAWGHLRPAVLGPGFATGEFLTARLAIDPQHIPAVAADLPAFASRVGSLRAEVVRQIEAAPGVSAVTLAAALPGAEPATSVEIDEGAAGARRVRRYVFQSESGRSRLLLGIRGQAPGGPHV